MNILLATGIYPPDIGGPASFTCELARELKRRGQEPTVVCYGDEQTLRGEGWEVSVVSRRGPWFVRYFRYALRVYGLARKSDVVFLQGPVSEGYPGMIAARLAHKPTLMKIVGDYAWEIYRQTPGNDEMLDEFVTHPHAGSVNLRENFERWSAKHASRIVVPSQYLKKIVTAWGVEPEKISVIYNTIPSLPHTESREALRQRFSVQDKNVITYIGRCVPWKHIDFIIGLLPQLPSDRVLAIGGDGPSLEEWKKAAEQNHVSDRVKFLGRLDRQQVADWYAVSDLLVMPSSYEGFNHVIVEAASMGLPSLVSDKGGNTETKELFPQHVKVAPFLDKGAWKTALQNIPPRQAPITSQSFEDNAQAYLEMLKQVCAS